jgi:hypothetical protein
MQLFARQGTPYRLIVAHRPQGNGQAESLRKELVTKLRMYASDPSRAADWDLTAKECVYANNKSVHSAHGFTPFLVTIRLGYHPSWLPSVMVTIRSHFHPLLTFDQTSVPVYWTSR